MSWTDPRPHPPGPRLEPEAKPHAGATIAVWLLRLAVFAHALALFLYVFMTRQTQFGNVLFLELFDPRVGEVYFGFRLDDPYLAAVWVERVTVSLYLLAGLSVLVRPCWPVLLLMSAYALAEALSGTWFGGYRFNAWTLYADALRWGAPLALMLLVALPRVQTLNRLRLPLARDLLRTLVAVVFTVHGLQALYANPGFIDLIIGTFNQMLGLRVSEGAAVLMLRVIGVVDLAVALALLACPRPLLVPRAAWPPPPADSTTRRLIVPALLLWLAFWGFVTALSRLTALGYRSGLDEYPELLMRAPHFLAPLALWGLFAATYWPGGTRAGDAAPWARAEPAPASARLVAAGPS
ncbi:MAG: hypothetical protein WD009_08870 [Phycisphaeraceae bacterium]